LNVHDERLTIGARGGSPMGLRLVVSLAILVTASAGPAGCATTEGARASAKGGGPNDGDAASPGDASADGDHGPGAGGGGGGAPGGDASACYAEIYDPTASLDDLKGVYLPSGWLPTSLEVMRRRYKTGYFVLVQEETDPSLDAFADPSSWSNLMVSLMTMMHEESLGLDFASSSSTAHTYVLRDDSSVSVPVLGGMWPESEIAPLLVDDATASYDAMYLTGAQGANDVVFLVETLNAYANGLAALTAVADQITSQVGARDGVAALLYYLELYLRKGRTSHPAAYAALKADRDWQELVRLEWARGHFWDGEAQRSAMLEIDAARIWAHASAQENMAEIALFTGDDPSVVACHP
jgi:hypothetical protein